MEIPDRLRSEYVEELSSNPRITTPPRGPDLLVTKILQRVKQIAPGAIRTRSANVS
jgi:hypothetical protein